MAGTVTLNMEEISKKVLRLQSLITLRWLQEIEKQLQFEFTMPLEVAERRTTLIARSLVEDVNDDLQIWSRDMGNWMRSQQLPLSSILRTYQLYRNVFWSILRPELPMWALNEQEIQYLEQKIGQSIDEALYWGVYYFEQAVNAELSKKEEMISILHNDKLSILGKLAASMAHELRNPLCAIEGFLKLIREATKGQPKMESYIDVIMHEFSNLHRQITGFLSFSQKPILDEVFKSVCFPQLLDEVEVLIKPRIIAENVSFERHVESFSLPCYEEGLKQVLVHLFHNAIDAVQNTPIKLIRIFACTRGDRVLITVENTGEVIPSHLLEKLYQPFFTTKNNAGIGLSICKNIIEKHNGTIQCESKVELTRFLISLPQKQPPSLLGRPLAES
ncbi:MAG: GHKL domain-containing protein [Brevibacillus sp.]|nr:GHKL domain-containing protein [Brevibacillus sp.]